MYVASEKKILVIKIVLFPLFVIGSDECLGFVLRSLVLFKIVVQKDVHGSHLGRAILLNANPSNAEKCPPQKKNTRKHNQKSRQMVGHLFFLNAIDNHLESGFIISFDCCVNQNQL